MTKCKEALHSLINGVGKRRTRSGSGGGPTGPALFYWSSDHATDKTVRKESDT